MPHGRLVLGLHPPERVAVLDVASGALEERRLPGGTLCHGPLMVSGREVFFLGSRRGRGALMSLDLALERRARVVSWSRRQYLPSARDGAFWALGFRYDGRRARTSAPREVTPAGSVLFRSRRRPPAGYPMGATADGIVLEHRGRTRIWDPRSGAVRPAPGSWVVAASADRTAWCGQRCRRLRLEGPGGMLPARRLPADGRSAPAAARSPPTGRCSRWPPTASAARSRRGSRSCAPPTAPWSCSRRRCPPRAGSSPGRAPASGSTWPRENRRIAAYRPRDRRVVTLPVRLADDVIELVRRGLSRRAQPQHQPSTRGKPAPAPAGSSCSVIREKVITRRAPGAPRRAPGERDEHPLVGVAPGGQQPAAVRRPGEAREAPLAVEQRSGRPAGAGEGEAHHSVPRVGHRHAPARRVDRHHPRARAGRQAPARARGAVAAVASARRSPSAPPAGRRARSTASSVRPLADAGASRARARRTRPG